MNFLFLCSYRSWSGRGWPIFSMLDVLFSRWVFIHLSLHESMAVIGIPSPWMKKEIYFMLSNNKFLVKCWYGRLPLIRPAMDCERMVEKGINFILCLGTAYDTSNMESVGNYLVIFVGRNMPLKKLSLNLSLELWHLYKSLLPFAKGLSIYFMQLLFLTSGLGIPITAILSCNDKWTNTHLENNTSSMEKYWPPPAALWVVRAHKKEIHFEN